jgi:hypothetical protein
MSENDVARELLAMIRLPLGVAAIMPWHENGKVVMRVMVERQYMNSVRLPSIFSGYEVVVEEKQIAFAH